MAPINVQSFTENARDELLQLLGNVPGRKNLVLQKSLVGRIELLSKFSTLQEQGIDRIFFLENDNVDSSQRNVVFMVSGEKAQVAQAVAAQIKRLQQTASTDHDFTALWVPRRTLVCEKILEGAGVLGDVTSLEWLLYFHTLEKDLLSMELEDSFGELCFRHDPTSIFMAAKALMLMQTEHGLFPRILGKGENAKRLAELLVKMRPDAAVPNRNGQAKKHAVGSMPSTTIENLIIIDREVDMATPLMTQLTYEGLVDEMFDVRHGQTEVSSTIVGQASGQQSSQPDRPTSQPQPGGLKRKIRLDSTDKLYEQLRDAHFTIVGTLLNRVARRLQNEQTGYSGSQGQKSVAELRDMLSKLPGYQVEKQSLNIHTGLAEEVMNLTRSEHFTRSLEVQQNVIAGTDPSSILEILEDLIARDCPLQTILRLIALCSVVSGGLRTKDFDSLRRQVLNAYGHKHLLTLDNLEKMQLLTSRSGFSLNFPTSASGYTVGSSTAAPKDALRSDYATLRRSLSLILDDVSDQDPQDIAYTYSGYAPMSVRLVQCILQKPYLSSLLKSSTSAQYTESSSGWKGFEDALKSVKGPTVDEVQSAATTRPNGTVKENRSAKARQVLAGSGGRKTSVVFFLGGITFAEIAALRFLADKEKDRRDLLICTTGIISGNGVVGCATEG